MTIQTTKQLKQHKQQRSQTNTHNTSSGALTNAATTLKNRRYNLRSKIGKEINASRDGSSDLSERENNNNVLLTPSSAKVIRKAFDFENNMVAFDDDDVDDVLVFTTPSTEKTKTKKTTVKAKSRETRTKGTTKRGRTKASNENNNRGKKKKKKDASGSGYATPIATYFTSDEGSRHAATTTTIQTTTPEEGDDTTARLRCGKNMNASFDAKAKTPLGNGEEVGDDGGRRSSPVSMRKWMREALLNAPVKVGQKMKFDLDETPPNDTNYYYKTNYNRSSFASPKKVVNSINNNNDNNNNINNNINNNASNNSNAVTPTVANGGGMTTPRFKNVTPRDIFSSLRTTPI